MAKKAQRAGRRYRGVVRDGKRYAAVVTAAGRVYKVARWPTARDAAIAVDRAALHFKLKHPLNEPRASRRLGPASPAELRVEAVALRKSKTRGGSPFVGVERSNWSWAISLGIDYRTYSLDGFDTEEQAAVARDRVALHYQGDKARLNFPDRKLTPASFEVVEREVAERRLNLTSRRAKRPEDVDTDLPAALSAAARRAATELASPRKLAMLGQRAAEEHRKVARPKRSKLFGVYYVPRSARHPWIAQILNPNTSSTAYLGAWATEKEAAFAYDRAAAYYYGPGFERVNDPANRKKVAAADAASIAAEAFDVMKSKATSRFRGVYHQKGAWVASINDISVQGGTRYIGRYEREEHAAKAWDKEALKHWGKKAKLNFDPKSGEELGGRVRYDIESRRRGVSKT